MDTLTLRQIAIDTYRENVAYMNRDCKVYRSEGFQALNKIEIHQANDDPPVIAVLNVVDDDAITAPGELGLSEQAFRQLDEPEGTALRVAHAKPPASLKAVHRKIAGELLKGSEYLHIVQDILANRYSKIELAAFLVACSNNGMDRQEILHLTRA
ncbi:MAG: thymidine phosphorylase, partial [Pseudomonadota bacterium]|nr:thymidine phosphorylase [Pseudomonadota bacterium]